MAPINKREGQGPSPLSKEGVAEQRNEVLPSTTTTTTTTISFHTIGVPPPHQQSMQIVDVSSEEEILADREPVKGEGARQRIPSDDSVIEIPTVDLCDSDSEDEVVMMEDCRPFDRQFAVGRYILKAEKERVSGNNVQGIESIGTLELEPQMAMEVDFLGPQHGPPAVPITMEVDPEVPDVADFVEVEYAATDAGHEEPLGLRQGEVDSSGQESSSTVPPGSALASAGPSTQDSRGSPPPSAPAPQPSTSSTWATDNEIPCCSKSVNPIVTRHPTIPEDSDDEGLTAEELLEMEESFADEIMADLEKYTEEEYDELYPDEPLDNPEVLKEQVEFGQREFAQGSREQKKYFKELWMRVSLMPSDDEDEGQIDQEKAKKKAEAKRKLENANKTFEFLGGQESRSHSPLSVVSSVGLMGQPTPPESDEELDYHAGEVDYYDDEDL